MSGGGSDGRQRIVDRMLTREARLQGRDASGPAAKKRRVRPGCKEESIASLRWVA
jgi:hypothetical protein